MPSVPRHSPCTGVRPVLCPFETEKRMRGSCTVGEAQAQAEPQGPLLQSLWTHPLAHLQTHTRAHTRGGHLSFKSQPPGPSVCCFGELAPVNLLRLHLLPH